MNEVATWYGQPVESLSQAELIDVINHLASENKRIREENSRMMQSVDWRKYLNQQPAEA